MLSALVFDVDGTLADTEMVHLQAFNHAFAAEGMDWVWDVPTYTRLLEVSGGKERIAHYWREVNGGITDISGNALQATIDQLHAIKTAAYEQAVLDGAVALRPGVLRLIQAGANASLKMAIATTTSPVNIAALLRSAIGPDWASYFAVVEDASTAPNKKPHPQVYLQTLARLGLPAPQCVAFEDSANGLKSACAAGLATVITPNGFTAHQDFAGALRVLPSLESVTLPELAQWLEQA
jgi:HAD superfamily hydrolase (TIGR01509 family)